MSYSYPPQFVILIIGMLHNCVHHDCVYHCFLLQCILFFTIILIHLVLSRHGAKVQYVISEPD